MADAAVLGGLSPRPTPSWFSEAKLGIMVHWGPYSVPAWAEPIGPLGGIDGETWFTHNPYAEWYYNTIRIPGSPAAIHHERMYGGAHYDAFIDQWQAEEFDAAGWADLFWRAGADYVLPTTKHHDGFALWDAPGTGQRNAVRSGPRRDLVAEIASAVRARGMRFGVYYSGGLDWSIAPELPPHRDHVDVVGIRPRDEAYHTYAASHLTDLILRLAPSMLWNDIDWPDAGKHSGQDGLPGLLSFYYDHVPEGVVNDRWGIDYADFRTSEYEAGVELETGVWQNTRGIGYSFGYNRVENADVSLSGAQLARYWVDVVARGGQLLLNVGPTASGRIPDVQRATLSDFANWRSAVPSPSRVRAWDAPEKALGVDNGPWTRYWNDPDGVIAFVDSPGRHRLTLPNGRTVEVEVRDRMQGPAVFRFPNGV